MSSKPVTIPDHTAVRVALWRALHVELDAAPHVFRDEIGAAFAAPEENWRQRGDMHPIGTRGYRASIVARARWIEDVVQERVNRGVSQYVILGAGLDSFAQRRPDLATKVRVFEIDRPATQEWKKKRLEELGFGIAPNLQFVPVDFEAGDSWWEKLKQNGFDASKPAVIASAGVSMYLTKEANRATLKQMASLAPGSAFVMSFILTMDLIEPEDRPGHEMVYEKARAAGTPFVSFFRPEELVTMALEAGFKNAEHASRAEIIAKYFAGRVDGLVPSSGEELLIATT